ncbi:MAG TPA: ABC transporter permease subunit, partial [Myxococcota bacterium]|nr:ABC transporter permease subunit [Myxococcota bacterium]
FCGQHRVTADVEVIPIQKLNEAIMVMFRSGDLEKIYTRYGMWNKDQEILKQIIESGRFYGYNSVLEAQTEEQTGPAVTADEVKESEESSKFDKVVEFAGYLTTAAGMTVVLSAISFPLAIIIGMFIAVGRLYGPVWIQIPLTAYVEGLRGTPLMLQLYFIFYFLPELGITIPAFATAIIGLAVNYSAYESEIYRAGLQAIPTGQMEAALSLGMSRTQALRRIIVPQAFRIVIPPVMNDFIAMFKDTSVCSVVTIVELTKRFSILSRNNVQSLIELMVLTAVLYLLMSYPMSLLARRLEKTLARESA